MGGAVGKDNDDLTDKLADADYIKSPFVEEIFRAVDRKHYMLETVGDNIAYSNSAWKANDIHLSAPCIYAVVLEALQLKPGLSFLNLGSGTGYLSTMVGLILGSKGVNHGIELIPSVVEYAHEKMASFKKRYTSVFDRYDFCEPVFIQGNFFDLDIDNDRKYDRIYCAGMTSEQDATFIKKLLKIGGILIIPLDNNYLYQIIKISNDEWETNTLLQVSFVRCIKSTNETTHLKLPPLEVRSLTDLCRSQIREILRKNIDIDPSIVALKKKKNEIKRHSRDNIINIHQCHDGYTLIDNTGFISNDLIGSPFISELPHLHGQPSFHDILSSTIANMANNDVNNSNNDVIMANNDVNMANNDVNMANNDVNNSNNDVNMANEKKNNDTLNGNTNVEHIRKKIKTNNNEMEDDHRMDEDEVKNKTKKSTIEIDSNENNKSIQFTYSLTNGYYNNICKINSPSQINIKENNNKKREKLDSGIDLDEVKEEDNNEKDLIEYSNEKQNEQQPSGSNNSSLLKNKRTDYKKYEIKNDINNTISDNDNKDIKHDKVNNDIEHDGVNKDIEHDGVNKDIEHDKVNKYIEHDGVNSDIEHDGVNNDIEHNGVNKDIEHDGVNSDIEHDGVNNEHDDAAAGGDGAVLLEDSKEDSDDSIDDTNDSADNNDSDFNDDIDSSDEEPHYQLYHHNLIDEDDDDTDIEEGEEVNNGFHENNERKNKPSLLNRLVVAPRNDDNKKILETYRTLMLDNIEELKLPNPIKIYLSNP